MIAWLPHTRRLARSPLVCVATIICASLSLRAQARFISGVVETEDGRRLAGVSVRVTNVGDRPTLDSGEFRIPLSQEFQPGSEIEFYIAGWRIKSPYQGREFVPREPTATIHIIVARTAIHRAADQAPRPTPHPARRERQ